jgi:hypothetical protein
MNRVRIERGAGAGEPIDVWPSQAGAAPTEFVWRGQRYRVRAVEPWPALSLPKGGPRVPGAGARRFRVRTTSGLSCVLAQDLARGAWRMDRLVPSGGGR